jgi:DNA-binding MarR family transcriptional regulator
VAGGEIAPEASTFYTLPTRPPGDIVPELNYSMVEENADATVKSQRITPGQGTRDALIDEVDAQVWMLGRLFSSRHIDACASGQHPEPSELSMPQYVLLRVLADMGPTKMADIASTLGTKAPAVSALVDHAHKAGHVVREPDAEDRRVTRAALTESGRAVLADAEAHRREMLRRYTSILSDEDLAALIRIQRALIGALVSEKI